MKKAKMTFMAILASFAVAGAGAAVAFVANPISIVETKADDAAEYDLTKISGFSSWTTAYGDHSLTQASFSPAVATAASLNFKITNKQSKDVGSTYPCIGAKTTDEMECLRFTLGVEGKKISSVTITFVTRYTSTYPSLYLHKGAGIASAAVSNIDMSGDAGNEVELSAGNINDTIFTVGYNANQTSKNGAVGIKSIVIGLADAEAFGTLDHIKVTSLPNTTYHVGEAYDSTGFAVTAYDGENEATANFKDVTASVTQTLENGYLFKDTDVPGFDETVQYTESEKVVETSYHVSVYALAQYRLVTSAPADWSGNYLIVGENADKDVCAMNGALTNPDVETGYKVVNPADGVIETGQELQWTIAAYDGGYSVQGKSGKYIGSLATASNGMLVSAEALKNTLSYSTDASVITGTNGYGLTFNTTGDRFRYYSGGTVQLYKLIESDAADTYAQSFLATLSTGESPVCQYNPDTSAVTTDLAALKAAWASLAEQYDTALAPAEKEQFRLGAASVEGSNIQKALALYDHIASAYGEKLESGSLANFDFMNRGIVSGTLGIGAGVLAGNNTAIILIALFSAATIAVAGGILFAKKQKKKAE